MSRREPLTRGKLAGRSGVNIATIRYYEKRGLLPDAPRTRTGYRMYADNASFGAFKVSALYEPDFADAAKLAAAIEQGGY